jgi:hypothetical protein
MASVSGIGPGIQGAQLANDYQAAVLRLQKDAVQLQGSLALQLIEAAATGDPAVGGNLNIAV